MVRSVEAQSLAFFGKSDPKSDYSWLRGREAIPEALIPVCEALIVVTTEAATATSVVTSLGEELYLLRAFRSAMDSAFRPVYGLEVAAIRRGKSLVPADWLSVAHTAVCPETLDELDASGGKQVLSLNEATQERSEVGPAILNRLHLGIPFRADLLVALELLRCFPTAFSGVAFAVRRSQGNTVRWVPALQGYLAVNLEEPELTAEQKKTLEAVALRPPSTAEWQLLARVGAERAREAVIWAATVKVKSDTSPPSCPMAGLEDPLLEWLIVFRRESYRGADRLAVLRCDLGLEALPPRVLENACPELSLESRRLLERAEWPSAEDPATAALVELSGAGYLDGRSPPLTLWAHRTAESPLLAARALEILAAAGATPAAARLALNLEADGPPTEVESTEAARQALSFRLPVPWGALLQGLEDHGAKGLSALAAWSEIAGGAPAALIDLLRHGSLPQPEQIPPEPLLRTLRAAAKLEEPVDVPALALSFAVAHRWDEVNSLLAAMARGEIPDVGSLARSLILALRGQGEAVAGASAAELGPLARMGLAQPETTVPPAEETEFIALADLWTGTAPLGALIGGKTTIPGPCPPSWRPAVQALFTPERATKWLEALPLEGRSAAGSWLVATLDLPPILGALATDANAAERVDGEMVLGYQPWLAAMFVLDGEGDALFRLAALARSRTLEGKDKLAADFVKQVLPQASHALAALLVHLLSGVGPFPRLAGLTSAQLERLLPAADPVALVDALFLGDEPALTQDSQLVSRLRQRIVDGGRSCPQRRYTEQQRRTHPILAQQLSQIQGWEGLSLDATMRLGVLQRLAQQLDVKGDELVEAFPIRSTQGEDNG